MTTEIILAVLLVILVIRDYAKDKAFLAHIKELEFKLLTGQVPEAGEPNDIEEKSYRDLDQITPQEALQSIKNKG